MLNFADIRTEDSFQLKDGYTGMFGSQIGQTEYPIDFEYVSSESVISFVAVKEDVTGATIETINLSTSLITSNGKTHKCNGQTAFTTALECGMYHFLVNGWYQSESFYAIDIDKGIFNDDSVIFVSGLEFYDSNYDVSETDKLGAPWLRFAREFGTNMMPLDFCYKSNQSVSSFELVQVDNNYREVGRESLPTSLITSDGKYHKCTGLASYTDIITCGIYYFEVNGRFRSKVFEIFELLCAIISNINVSNAIEGETAVLTFDAYLTGAVQATDIDFTITFSNEIETIETTVTLVSSITPVSLNVPIPYGTDGLCLLTISNNVCSKGGSYQFNITPVLVDCLELYDGLGNLGLYDGLGCLQLYP